MRDLECVETFSYCVAAVSVSLIRICDSRVIVFRSAYEIHWYVGRVFSEYAYSLDILFVSKFERH